MNDNYLQRLGIGFIISMILVLTLFQWTFPVKEEKSPAMLDELVTMSFVPLADAPTILEKEKKQKVKKVALAKANIKLVDEVKKDVQIALETKEPVVNNDSISFQEAPQNLSGKAKQEPVEVVKKRIKESEPEVFVAVEEMPRFGDCMTSGRGKLDDCSTQQLLKFIGEKVVYPSIAKELGITGRVIAQFVVERNGEVSHVKILRTPNRELGQEVIRVLKRMPKWKPGKQQGVPVRVKYIIPVVFDVE